jgi:hypothetical protein
MRKLNLEYKITIIGVVLSVISVFVINGFLNNKKYNYEPIKVKETYTDEEKDTLLASDANATSTTSTTTTTTTTTTTKAVVENKTILKMGSEVLFDNLTKDELIDRLNKNLYDTLAGTGKFFADYTEKTGLDPYLSVAIVNLETGCKWGCSYLTRHNYNIGGLKGGNGYLSFSSLEEGIDSYLSILYNNYWSQGLTTPELMNPKYAASDMWATKVNNYINEIKAS